MDDTIIRDEIGSEFWDVPTAEREQISFPERTKWFISGTSALQYIIQDAMHSHKIACAAIPSWCCSCMIKPFIRRGIRVFFYSVYVDEAGTLTKDYTTVPPCDITLCISYFGYLDQKTVGTPGGVVIRDSTHSLLCENNRDGAYYFGSMRKWAGFWTGGYAWKCGEWADDKELPAVDPDYIRLRKGAMESKLRYLRGKCENKDYLRTFEEAEEYLDRCSIMGGSARDVIAARHFDLAAVKARRRQNAECLLAELREYALFGELSEDDCPLFVPVILNNERRNGLRRFLIENRVYCPVHWEITDLHRLTGLQKRLYEQELSIVCDQRYGPREMKRITGLVKDYLRTHS